MQKSDFVIGFFLLLRYNMSRRMASRFKVYFHDFATQQNYEGEETYEIQGTIYPGENRQCDD